MAATEGEVLVKLPRVPSRNQHKKRFLSCTQYEKETLPNFY
jgi:hypothetical protein